MCVCSVYVFVRRGRAWSDDHDRDHDDGSRGGVYLFVRLFVVHFFFLPGKFGMGAFGGVLHEGESILRSNKNVSRCVGFVAVTTFLQAKVFNLPGNSGNTPPRNHCRCRGVVGDPPLALSVALSVTIFRAPLSGSGLPFSGTIVGVGALSVTPFSRCR